MSVSPEDEVSIKDVATIIANKFNYVDHLVFDNSYSDGQYKKTADNSKLINLYGNHPFIKIKEGINNSIEWFIDNYDTCRK